MIYFWEDICESGIGGLLLPTLMDWSLIKQPYAPVYALFTLVVLRGQEKGLHDTVL